MKIANEFTVSAPIEDAWDVLTDLEQVIPLMPAIRDGCCWSTSLRVVLLDRGGVIYRTSQITDRHLGNTVRVIPGSLIMSYFQRGNLVPRWMHAYYHPSERRMGSELHSEGGSCMRSFPQTADERGSYADVPCLDRRRGGPARSFGDTGRERSFSNQTVDENGTGFGNRLTVLSVQASPSEFSAVF